MCVEALIISELGEGEKGVTSFDIFNKEKKLLISVSREVVATRDKCAYTFRNTLYIGSTRNLTCKKLYKFEFIQVKYIRMVSNLNLKVV